MEPTTQTIDPELDALKDKVPGLEDQPEPEPAEDKTKAAPPKKEEEPSNDRKKDEEPTKDPEPEEDEEEEEEDPNPTNNRRPERYIPVKQYTSEKSKWKEQVDGLQKQIDNLQQGKNGDKKVDDAIKAYAEKHGVDEDSVRDLVNVLGGPKKDPEQSKSPEFTPDQIAQIERANEITAAQAFKDEFESLAVPQIMEAFPKATPEQINAAKKEIEKLACTNKYLDKTLDFVVFKERESLSEFFAADRKGPESSREAPIKGNPTYSAADFKGGKTSFTTLSALPVEEQTKIIESMDNKTYEDYSHWINQNDTLALNRGGRRIKH